MPYKTQAIIIQNGTIRANVMRTDDLGQPAGYLDIALVLDEDEQRLANRMARRAERRLERREEEARAARLANPEAKIDLTKPLEEENETPLV